MVDLTTPTPRSRTVQTEVTSLPILNRRCPNFSLMPSSFPSPRFPNIFNFLLRLWLLIFFNKFKPLLNLRTYCFSYFHQHLLLTLQSFTREEHYLPFRSAVSRIWMQLPFFANAPILGVRWQSRSEAHSSCKESCLCSCRALWVGKGP